MPLGLSEDRLNSPITARTARIVRHPAHPCLRSISYRIIQRFQFDNWPGQAHYGSKMKPAPAVPGETEAERMKNALRMMFSVPKEAYLREEARLKRARDRKRARKQTP